MAFFIVAAVPQKGYEITVIRSVVGFTTKGGEGCFPNTKAYAWYLLTDEYMDIAEIPFVFIYDRRNNFGDPSLSLSLSLSLPPPSLYASINSSSL